MPEGQMLDLMQDMVNDVPFPGIETMTSQFARLTSELPCDQLQHHHFLASRAVHGLLQLREESTRRFEAPALCDDYITANPVYLGTSLACFAANVDHGLMLNTAIRSCIHCKRLSSDHRRHDTAQDERRHQGQAAIRRPTTAHASF